jgi:Zn-dependent protease
MQDPTISLLSVALLIFSAALHEVAHGLTALYYGDHTAEQAGRLSLNPLRHIDPIGSVVLPILLSLVGSPFVFGWAKPVPVNTNNLRTRYASAVVALAGPATNLLLAGIAGTIIRFYGASLEPGLVTFLFIVVSINCVLALFNLIPIPPLDGYHVIEYLFRIPARITNFFMQYSFVFIFAAIIVFQKFFDGIFLFMIRLLTGTLS